MADKDYSPLSSACVRALNDKLYDKRKAAALEIEKMARDFNNIKNETQLKKLLKVLGQDFTLSNNPNSRKGGLIGLAAMAIALGKESQPYIEEMLRPMLSCFSDQDSRVRYYACEALYNVVKVSRCDVLPLFNEVFDSLCKLAADPDQNVKSGAELLDRLMKDIVTESPTFNLIELIDLIRDRIHGTNQFSRQFIISWIALLDSVPDFDMIVFLPKLLDGLFHILSDPTPEINRTTENVMAEFLFKIIQNPSKVDFPSMINILTIHSQVKDEPLVQYTALTWLKEFINLANSRDLLPFSASILTAILPCLTSTSDYGDDFEDKNKSTTNINIREVAKVLNYSLMQLVTLQDNQHEDGLSPTHAINNESHNTNVSDLVQNSLDLTSVLEILVRELKLGENASTLSKLAVLRWILHLYSKVPQKIVTHLESELFPGLLKTLSDKSDEVVLMDLKVLAQIFSAPTVSSNSVNNIMDNTSYFNKFMRELLKLFHKNSSVLEERGSFIIRQLCQLMTAEDIYRSMSEILLNYEDLRFAYTIVQTLNTILLTSSELFELRNQLKHLKTDESCALFCCLYRTWCHSPIATVSLCFLTKNYKHASDLLLLFGDLNLTLEFLTELDQMVQLLESPIFAYLRLDLLDVENNWDLIKSLYGLLMLLPQSDAFDLLRKRLQCVPNFRLTSSSSDSQKKNKTKSSPMQPNMDFKELLRHFHLVQQKHQNWSRNSETLNRINDRSYNV
ncbi:protein VAC14 homolog [Oppia nitens]|uniref:protein VAC14 homolog n=1 Tax=Oppia nitens TaxID=1686743 RepID=UPI0023DA8D53|nr:protein VAC14 homolog [Oppia nitens]